MSEHRFRAAAVAVDITPDLAAYEIRLHGYGARGLDTATGVHDPLHGKVLLLERDGELACIVTMDILQIDGLLLDDVAERAALPGLARTALAVCASHTHSAPAALQKRTRNLTSRRMRWYEEEYYDHCVAQLASAIRQAAGALAPATCAVGSARLGGMVRNRRVPSYDYGTRGFNAPLEEGVVADDELVVLQFAG